MQSAEWEIAKKIGDLPHSPSAVGVAGSPLRPDGPALRSPSHRSGRFDAYNTGMLELISPSELNLLRSLHEHTGSSGDRVALEPKFIWRRLRISEAQFAQDSASLVKHDFAGVRNCRPDANDVPSLRFSSIWLTRKGEDYLKQSERPSSIA